VQLVFSHQRVWDPAARETRLLRSDSEFITRAEDFDFLGPPLPTAAARDVCSHAALDPRTLLPTGSGSGSGLRMANANQHQPLSPYQAAPQEQFRPPRHEREREREQCLAEEEQRPEKRARRECGQQPSWSHGAVASVEPADAVVTPLEPRTSMPRAKEGTASRFFR